MKYQDVEKSIIENESIYRGKVIKESQIFESTNEIKDMCEEIAKMGLDEASSIKTIQGKDKDQTLIENIFEDEYEIEVVEEEDDEEE